MTSVADRKRNHRRSRALAPQGPRPKLTVVAATVKPPPVRDMTGLEWLRARGRISDRQAAAGVLWGRDYRRAMTDGLEPLRSCLNDAPRGGGNVAPMSYAVAETEALARRQMAMSALSDQPDMIEALDALCGRQLTPWEHVREHGGGQRRVEEIQTTVRLALDILARHYRT